ncbi:hypothetical protein [Alterinioella nitratireducens]|uniref:hypothetical protein n=1 Tax=Alterinioella nitratireducens TaxID=2735915 RepID=UPI004057E87C
MTDVDRIEKASELVKELNNELQRLAHDGIEVKLFVRHQVQHLGGHATNDVLDADFVRPLRRIWC